jgi:glycogen phosphorylase
LNLADLKAYLDADKWLVQLYANQDAWTQKAVLNVASSGTFSSDRTIAEYARDIFWKITCPGPFRWKVFSMAEVIWMTIFE